ncbi:MAG: adenosylcobinamide-GDP ribazoletransferase [Desulfobulbaceae bacterium]|nr:MAG: adenosylcobinamide-GDP ribazoletransferase [Desulfobulbaceae bacterium]
MLTPLRTALAFLTIMPVAAATVSDDDMARSMTFFPAAGLLVGALLAALAWGGLCLGIPRLGLAVLLVAASAWLSRALHLDGVADLCDGLGGAFEVERRLQIMKDSHIGAFGVVGLVLLLLLKVAGLHALLAGGTAGLGLLAMVPATARLVMLVTAYRACYPRQAGTGHFVVGKISGGRLLAGGLFLLPLAWYGWSGLLLVSACLLPGLWLRLKAQTALGGVTGDVLGAVIEWSEAAGWLVAALLLAGGGG